jgi:thiamine-phosphate pyrophosphorylase
MGTSERQPVPERAAPRLYVVVRAAAAAGHLAAALDAADVAAVLVRPGDADERTLIGQAKALALPVQAKGAALLLDGHAGLVARAGADGAHLTGIETFTGALPTLRPQGIAGCGGLATRHDAMLAAEAGADYVMFGEPDESGHWPGFDAVLERVVWWAEVFEVPCVGFAASREEAFEFAAAGADFVLAGDFIWADPRGARAALIDAAQAIQQAHDAALEKAKAGTDTAGTDTAGHG